MCVCAHTVWIPVEARQGFHNASPERRGDPALADRWIKVSWGSDTNESYPTTLEVVAKDRLNLLLDVSAALSTTKTFVSGVHCRSTDDGFAIARQNPF